MENSIQVNSKVNGKTGKKQRSMHYKILIKKNQKKNLFWFFFMLQSYFWHSYSPNTFINHQLIFLIILL